MFRRKRAAAVHPDEADGTVPQDGGEPTPAGPFDIEDVGDDGVDRVDLGSLLVAPEPDREVRIQVNDTTQAVQSVLIAGEDGAVEVRAFAAPRNGDLWSEARRQIIAEAAQQGGTATEQEGRFGTEVLIELSVQLPDGKPGIQHQRLVGVNGSRWMLRGSFIGAPATDPAAIDAWDQTLAALVVNRGGQAMPPGDALPLSLPPEARRG